ncbi:hypothetical protein PUATCC27989T_04034 [Phytobacter ursingii]|nr:hypothetical protein TUM17576_14370 [Enterobacter hormaechei]VTP16107.1 hypothetical protein PUATCC27989T_04034 [Phytobacter ursingii]
MNLYSEFLTIRKEIAGEICRPNLSEIRRITEKLKLCQERKATVTADLPPRLRRVLQPFTIADNANRQAFNGEVVLTQVNHDWGKLTVFRQ